MRHFRRMKWEDEQLQIPGKRSAVSAYLKEIIYGGVDGSITTFAVVAGFSGAALSNETTSQLSFLVVLLFGLANLFADGVSMGLGNFLAVRSDQSLYKSIRDKEEQESVTNEETEVEETRSLLIARGFSSSDADTLTSIYQKNEPYWIEFMMNNEMRMSNPTQENPVATGLATFASFLFFGIIPLVPFMTLGSTHPKIVFLCSTIGTFVAFLLLGILKWKVVGNIGLMKAVGEIVLIGGVAATVAFFVGTLFTV